MSGSILGNKADSRTTKTLYTPVLYHHVPELSASSTPETGRCSTYLKRLTREHLARASMEEIGSSVAFSPASQARVSKWMARVKRAFTEANGNVADGRWALVSDLLRLHCTRGGPRWLGVNLDLQAPEVPKQLCLIPKTSEEWDDLERRIKGEDDVNSKVQRWIRSAEFTPLSPGATVNQSQTLHGVSSLSHRDPNPSTKVTQTSLKTGFSMSYPLSSGSKFGFNVVKRPNVIKDSNKSRNSLSSPPPSDPNPPPTSHVRDHSDHEPSHETVHPFSPIINQTLKPLPFPDSQIQTSTPLPNPQDDIRDSNPSCEPSSFLGCAGFSDQSHHEGDVASNRKRARSGSLEPPVAKRPRSAVEEIGSSPQLRPEDAELLVTLSTTRNLPRVTELLALSPHQKHNTPQRGASKIPVDSSPSIHTSDARDHPERSIVSPELQVKDSDDLATNFPGVPASEMPLTTLQLGASTIKTPGISSNIAGHDDFVDPQPAIQPAVGPVLEEDDDVPSIIEEALKVCEPRPHTPVHPPPLQKDQFHFPVDPKLLMSKLDAKTYNLYGLDLLDNTPAKSLSSLAGSDADSDSDSDFGKAQTLEKIIEIVPERLHQHPVDPDFNPCATSTQKPGLEINLASNMGLSGHTTLDNLDWRNDHLSSASQLQAEVNGQVNEFDKFMEADLSYDQVVSEF